MERRRAGARDKYSVSLRRSVPRLSVWPSVRHLPLASLAACLLHSRPLADFYPLTPANRDGCEVAKKRPAPPPREVAVHIHLLGTVDFEDCLSLQRRLAYDALSRADGRIVVLICEHPPLITIGRGGSRATCG